MSSVAATKTARQEFWDGVRDEIPLMLGVFPFGMVFGVLGVEAGLEPLVVMAMSVIVFGGASQVVFCANGGRGRQRHGDHRHRWHHQPKARALFGDINAIYPRPAHALAVCAGLSFDR